jgi:hypothetical protein
VDHLRDDHDEILALNDLHVVVVGSGQRRQRSRDAAFPQAAVFRVVRVDAWGALRSGSGACLIALGGLGQDWRDPSVGRVDDERRLLAREGLARIPPEIVVARETSAWAPPLRSSKFLAGACLAAAVNASSSSAVNSALLASAPGRSIGVAVP